MSDHIYVIGNSGGPGGGKSSLQAVSHERYPNLPNWAVITIPEAATLLIPNAGLDMPGMAASDRRRYLETQGAMLDAQLALRKVYLHLAELAPEENVIVLEDRTPLDGAAYMTDTEFTQLLASRGLSREEIYSWYHGFIFLRTAAKGAEKFYTTANNAARSEGLEVARMVDDWTERAYVGCPRIVFIDNQTDFEGKIQRAVQAISHMVGLPAPTQIQRKFLLGPRVLASGLPDQLHTRTIEMEQKYLDAPVGEENRIRRRSDGADSSFYQSWKVDTSELGVRLRREIAIDRDTYESLARTAVSVLRKQRTAFVFEDQYYWIDQVTSPEKLTILEVELTNENGVVRLPDWLGPAREVTSDANYRMAAIAGRGVGGLQLG